MPRHPCHRLGLSGFPCPWGIFHNTFTVISSIFLKPYQTIRWCEVLLPAWDGIWSCLPLHMHKLLFFISLILTSFRLRRLGFCPKEPLPLFYFSLSLFTSNCGSRTIFPISRWLFSTPTVHFIFRCALLGLIHCGSAYEWSLLTKRQSQY